MMNGMSIGIIAWLAVAIIIIIGITNLVRSNEKDVKKRYLNDPGEALEILRNRYASGEINSEEFEKIKSDILKI